MKWRAVVVLGRKKTPLRLWKRVFGVGLVMLVGLGGAACSRSAAPTAEPTSLVPTRTLPPPSATPTPAPHTPTPTDLPGPEALRPSPSPESAREQPLSALLALTLDDLRTRLDQDPVDVRLLSVDSFRWATTGWECARPAADAQDAVRSAGTRGYRIVYAVDGRAYVYHTDTRGAFFLCRDRQWLALEGEPVLLDPIAEALVDRSRRDAARRLDVAEDDLRLVSVLTLVWPDASLGCPKTNADYPERETPGYRIVFRTQDATAIYHTSAQDVLFCTPEEELLPGIVRRALPSSTP